VPLLSVTGVTGMSNPKRAGSRGDANNHADTPLVIAVSVAERPLRSLRRPAPLASGDRAAKGERSQRRVGCRDLADMSALPELWRRGPNVGTTCLTDEGVLKWPAAVGRWPLDRRRAQRYPTLIRLSSESRSITAAEKDAAVHVAARNFAKSMEDRDVVTTWAAHD